MFRLVDRLPSPWPREHDAAGVEPAADPHVFVDISTGPFAVADLIALMVGARRNRGAEPLITREFAGCRPAIAFDHPDGRPRPVASSARRDEWMQAVVATACPDTFAEAAAEPVEVINRRLRPPTPTVQALAPAHALRGTAIAPPVVTVILPRTQRSLTRLDASARQVVAELSRTLAGGKPPIAPPGADLSASAEVTAKRIHAEESTASATFTGRIDDAFAAWRADHERLGVLPPDRVTESLTAHAALVARQLARAADDESTTRRAHAEKIALQLTPFALPQELSLSADWLADLCGGPARLCIALCEVLDFDATDHQLIELD